MSVLPTVAEDVRPAEGTLVICDSESLQIWQWHLRAVIRPDRLPAVHFALPALSRDQNRALSALAHEYRRACGCGSAGVATGVAIVAAAATYFAIGGQLDAIGVRHAIGLVGITALALFAGKLFGLLWARWRLWRLASELSEPTAGTAR